MLYSLDKDMIRLRSVLRPLVTVEDQSISDLFFLFGLFQGLGDQCNRVVAVKDMSHNKAIVEVFDGGQIAQPCWVRM